METEGRSGGLEAVILGAPLHATGAGGGGPFPIAHRPPPGRRMILQAATWHEDTPIKVGGARYFGDGEHDEFLSTIEDVVTGMMHAPRPDDPHVYLTLTVRVDWQGDDD